MSDAILDNERNVVFLANGGDGELIRYDVGSAGIFVIWDGIALVATRIEHVPHSEPPRVELKSLNPEYGSYECLSEAIRVVGRAVWASKKL